MLASLFIVSSFLFADYHLCPFMACPTIDFHDAERATRSMPILPDSRYQPQSMTVDSPRAGYLASFPRKNIVPRGEFLLANVPGSIDPLFFLPLIFEVFVLVSRLGAYEQVRREHHAHSADSLALVEHYTYQGFFSMNQPEVEEFSCRFRVPLSVVLFNLNKLSGICSQF